MVQLNRTVIKKIPKKIVKTNNKNIAVVSLQNP